MHGLDTFDTSVYTAVSPSIFDCHDNWEGSSSWPCTCTGHEQELRRHTVQRGRRPLAVVLSNCCWVKLFCVAYPNRCITMKHRSAWCLRVKCMRAKCVHTHWFCGVWAMKELNPAIHSWWMFEFVSGCTVLAPATACLHCPLLSKNLSSWHKRKMDNSTINSLRLDLKMVCWKNCTTSYKPPHSERQSASSENEHTVPDGAARLHSESREAFKLA